MCYTSCLTEHTHLYPHILQSGNPREDSQEDTCSNCSSEFPKLSKGYCKETCDNDECYFTSNPKECKSINENYYYIDNSIKKYV